MPLDNNQPLVRVCDDGKGDEADAEWDVDTAVHVGWVLDRGALLHELEVYSFTKRIQRSERGIDIEEEEGEPCERAVFMDLQSPPGSLIGAYLIVGPQQNASREEERTFLSQ